MISVAYDLSFLQAGVPDLENYLLSKEIYWPMGGRPPAGEPPFPRLTLGWALLSHKRVHARTLTPQQAQTLGQLDNNLQAVRTRWQVAWERKAGKEFQSRLNLWANFINDYRRAPKDHASRYPYEVNRRVLLHLLAQETRGTPEQLRSLLAGMDKALRAALQPGEFLWDEELRGAFPSDVYWYLYGEIKRA